MLLGVLHGSEFAPVVVRVVQARLEGPQRARRFGLAGRAGQLPRGIMGKLCQRAVPQTVGDVGGPCPAVPQTERMPSWGGKIPRDAL